MERIASLLTIALVLAACGQGEARADREPAATAEPRPSVSEAAPIGDEEPGMADPAAADGGGANGAIPETPAGAAPTAGTTPDGSTPNAAAPPATSTPSARPGPDEPVSSPADGSRQQEILRATARAYEGLRSFRATFEQTLDNTLLGRSTRSEGTLFQRQPDRFLMRFTDPAGDVIVSDGTYFWMYFPSVDAKQVIRSRRGGQGLDLRSQFIGDPVRRFDATSHGTEAVRGREAHVMTLVPREQLGYQRLKVWIDARDHLVRRFELTENNGNIRRFLLSDLATNPSLPDDLFQFTPPAGAQVVER